MTAIFSFLENLPWVLGALIIVLSFVFLAIAGLLVVRRLVSTRDLKAHHDVAGFVFTNLGVLYSVLLGFTVLNVQQRFDKVEQVAWIEASFISQIYRDAEAFSEKDKHAIQEAIKNYTESVITDEWGAMSQGRVSHSTKQALKSIWHAYYDVTLADKKQEIWYAESIGKLNQLMSARLTRILGGNQSLGVEMWTLLILGGLGMVTFIWFFHVESFTCHILMAAILAATVAFLLFLIFSLDTIFSGEVSVSPEAFINILKNFG